MTATTEAATDLGAPPPAPPLGSPPTGRSRRWPLVAAVVIAVVAVTAVVIAVLVLRPRHHRSSAPVPPTSTGPAQQRKLASALDAANGITMHATYRALGDPAKLGGPLTYEVWQRPPDGREDRNGVAAARCHEDAKGTWTCQPVVGAAQSTVSGVPGPLDLLAVINNHASGESARDAVTTSVDVIGNQKVTCYQLAAQGETYVMCVAGNGTPELIANTTVRYELITVNSSVPSSVFTP